MSTPEGPVRGSAIAVVSCKRRGARSVGSERGPWANGVEGAESEAKARPSRAWPPPVPPNDASRGGKSRFARRPGAGRTESRRPHRIASAPGTGAPSGPRWRDPCVIPSLRVTERAKRRYSPANRPSLTADKRRGTGSPKRECRPGGRGERRGAFRSRVPQAVSERRRAPRRSIGFFSPSSREEASARDSSIPPVSSVPGGAPSTTLSTTSKKWGLPPARHGRETTPAFFSLPNFTRTTRATPRRPPPGRAPPRRPPPGRAPPRRAPPCCAAPLPAAPLPRPRRSVMGGPVRGIAWPEAGIVGVWGSVEDVQGEVGG